MSYFKSITALVLGLGLVLTSCSKQEPLTPNVDPNTEAPTNPQMGPTEVVSFSANLGFGFKQPNKELRALEGTTFYRGRLRPNIKNGEVKIWLYLGSETLKTLTPQELTFTYDQSTNSIHYRGTITVPEGLLKAPDLKMLMVAAKEANVSNNTITINQTLKSDVFVDKNFADGDVLPIDVPYFSDWIDVRDYVDGKLLDVARRNVMMYPQGHVIKMELSSKITALQNVMLQGYKIESTAVTDKGSYALPKALTDIGKAPVFTPTLSDPDHNFNVIELPIPEVALDNSTRTMFIWVGQIPSPATPWTRTFVKTKFNNPVLDPAFTGAWWDGFKNSKLFPVYYSGIHFPNGGSTMSMTLDNIMVMSPIDRMAYIYASNDYSNRGDYTVKDRPLKLGAWGHREYANMTRYTWSWLLGQNYVGDSPDEIVISDAKEPNSRNHKYYIPTLDEFRIILPTDQALSNVFRLDPSNKDNEITVNERVKLGNRKTGSKVYASTYQHYPKGDGTNNLVIGVRFKGGDNRHKMVYQYRALSQGNPSTSRIQIWTYYLGEYYPEIQKPNDFRNFTQNYPGATLPSIEERMLPWSMNNGTHKSGNSYWVNNSDGVNSTYVDYNYVVGSISEKKASIGDQSVNNTIIIMRDL